MRRVMIAAPKSGSGKTMITLGLLELLRKEERLVAFKCGPDYIDPMFHEKVLHIPSQNLDSFFLEKEPLVQMFCEECHRFSADLAIIEGVMGLYDGLGGISEQGSAYDVANCLQTPIIIVVDAHGMGRTIIPILAGLLSYDREHLIKGVILNQTTKSYYEMIKPVIEKELEIQVVGYVEKQNNINIDSRHLGLKLPSEIDNLHEKISILAHNLEKTINLASLKRIAEQVEELNSGNNFENMEMTNRGNELIKIAIACDEAFCFYYERNLQILKRLGADLIPFSPLHDQEIPKDVNGIILGGGYPELVADQLAMNESMKISIKKAIQNGMPSIAECGGFMYLHDTMILENGDEYKMVGIIPEAVSFQGKLVRFGYISIHEKNPHFLPSGEEIRGHEFHYYDSSFNGDCCVARKPVTSRNWECIYSSEKHWWGFPHLYYESNLNFAIHFIEKARKYEKEKW